VAWWIDELLGRNSDENYEDLCRNPRIKKLVQQFVSLAPADQDRVLTIINALNIEEH
jgi:hypothetical protein